MISSLNRITIGDASKSMDVMCMVLSHFNGSVARWQNWKRGGGCSS